MKVGTVIVLADRRSEGTGSADRYPRIRERAMRAEDVGYDSIWLYDHLLYREEGGEGTVGIGKVGQ